MADMSYLNPRTILRETRYPSAAEIARDPHRYTEASPVMIMRKCARKWLLEAGGFCALGAVAFGVAVVALNSEAPGWTAGVALTVYGVAATAGSIKYLESSEALLMMRDTAVAFNQTQEARPQIAEPPTQPFPPPWQPPPIVG